MSIVIDAEVSGFSSTSEEDTKTKQRKISTVKQVKEDKIKYILVSDGKIGKSCAHENIVFLSKEEATLKEAAGLGLHYIDKLPRDIQPIVMIQAGNTDVDPEHAGITEHSICYKEQEVEDCIRRRFIREMKTLAEVIKERGGILVITSLIPCPRTQCYETGDNRQYQNMQRILSNLYHTINDEIFHLNADNGVFTPDLKSVVEVSGRNRGNKGRGKQQYLGKKLVEEESRRRQRSRLYKGRLQKKIKVTMFEKDKKTPKKEHQQRMMKIAVKSLLHVKTNLWKTGLHHGKETRSSLRNRNQHNTTRSEQDNRGRPMAVPFSKPNC